MAVHRSQKINIELVILFLFKYSLERESALILNLFRCVSHSVILIFTPHSAVVCDIKKKKIVEKRFILSVTNCDELCVT